MRHFWPSVLIFLTPLADFATAVVPWDDMRIKHMWNAVPVHWQSLGHPSADTTIDLYISLKPDREGALVDALSEVSNPRHPRYRAYLSKEQVAEIVRPSPDTLGLVSTWLAHHGIPSSSISRTHGGSWLTVTDVHVSQANQLLGASFQLYWNGNTKETIIRTVGYSLPALLHTHIQTVAPTTDFSSMQVTVQTLHRRSSGAAPTEAQVASGMRVGPRQPPPQPVGVRPAELRWLYRTTEYQPVAAGRNIIGVVGSILPSQPDLNAFMHADRIGEEEAIITVAQVDGNLNVPSVTPNVAVQYATAMSYPTPLIFFRTAQDVASLLGFLHIFLNVPQIPQTISISYNYAFEHTIEEDYANSVCNLFAEIGLTGVSILVASGNNGVGAGACVAPHDGGPAFVVEFPSSCPWVTSVGGTQNINDAIATNLSGGGFSTFFPRPSYQDDVAFLDQLGDRYDGLYNPHGRGYPDISAQAFGCNIFFNGDPMVAVGTTCAVSTVAGIFALLNDFLISRRQLPLGFLNPLLYGDGLEGLTDIIAGSNPGCGTDGFPATVGWDPVTGLGTPNFQVLLNILRRIHFGPQPPQPPVPP